MDIILKIKFIVDLIEKNWGRSILFIPFRSTRGLFDDANGKICIVDDSGTTTLGPILSDIAGVLCPFGSEGSHLAIVSREFDIPCIMSVEFLLEDWSSLNGKKVKIVTESEAKGIIYLLE